MLPALWQGPQWQIDFARWGRYGDQCHIPAKTGGIIRRGVGPSNWVNDRLKPHVTRSIKFIALERIAQVRGAHLRIVNDLPRRAFFYFLPVVNDQRAITHLQRALDA